MLPKILPKFVIKYLEPFYFAIAVSIAGHTIRREYKLSWMILILQVIFV